MTAQPLKVMVKDIKRESPFVKSFTLIPAGSKPLPGFSGGSHITTYLRHNDQTMERHYSLTNTPGRPGYYKIAVKREENSKGGSIYFHESVQVGDQLDISYPKNNFLLSFQGSRHIFIAAGIGITPFMAMMKELKKQDKSFELHYAAKSKEACAFYNTLLSHFKKETHFYFSKENNRMNPELMKNQPIGTHVYFCGPEAMIKEYANTAASYGYPEANIHFELFSAPDTGPKHAFQVYLKRSNMWLEVPEGESLLDTLLAHEIDVPYSCKIGGCGSCQQFVSKGEIDHRDLFLTETEKRSTDVMMTCVSRANSPSIELDI
ncbi:PDR/VanB family oxidoreductase [Alteribacillus sp. YIM 98480]|uniref:PDR/VanB family oxidoreductase n=1 Tax=Alteribacillus sp. YIM 98480 TaxID=2606599 RepID=UPI001E4F25DA|nr:PDR/VanB family oxidoreductase [Alteribacillus sp. YIM 98480]